MDFLKSYGSDSESESNDEKREVVVKKPETKKVIKFEVPKTNLQKDVDYKPRKRAQEEAKSGSLFDILPAPAESGQTGRAELPKTASAERISPTSTSEYVKPLIEAAPVVPTNPNDMYKVGVGGQYMMPIQQQQQQQQQQDSQPTPVFNAQMNRSQQILEYALDEERERGLKKGKNKRALPQVLEINQTSLKGDFRESAVANPVRDALGEDYEANLRKQAGQMPSTMSRRRHQIGQLYYDAKMREIDLLENRAKSMKTKHETQAKYGW